MTSACSVHVQGVVQGVGFRPFVLRLARANTLAGWVMNSAHGVEIHIEGANGSVQRFLRDLQEQPPPAARITGIDVRAGAPAGLLEFTIRDSAGACRPTTRIAPDLPVCEACLRELFDPADRRAGYPYITCTNCGPRYSVIRALPYDRPQTTLASWPLDADCAAEYANPEDRRYHAQPVACHACGPAYYLETGTTRVNGSDASITWAADLLRAGKIVAVKGLGGFHLACDARQEEAVEALRARKFRKEKPFALMARDLVMARTLVNLSPAAEALLVSSARPIVLAPARARLPGVAPDHDELGVMLPYTPLHYLLFAAGAPAVLVMTSANRSSEPIAYEDDDARQRLADLADAFLIGERPIARRLDDSVARAGVCGPVILRRARGYAPEAVATLPASGPILALGADLKNTVTLVVEGQAFVSQYIGDLDDAQAIRAFRETVTDLVTMYGVSWRDLLVVTDAHPEYASTRFVAELPACETRAIQHHRAHVASVIAEHEAWETRVLGVSFDGTGWGDDGTIWGGEIFVGSARSGFERVAHLRPAVLAGGDAAARHPVQAAAGFLAQVPDFPDPALTPFAFGSRYAQVQRLMQSGVRTFTSTSMGRLFDAAAALIGFVRPITFEGQAAVWLEQLARRAPASAGGRGVEAYPFPFDGHTLDFRPLLHAIGQDRLSGRHPASIARAFQRGVACGLGDAVVRLCAQHDLETVVLSGGVFQNELLLRDLHELLDGFALRLWTNHRVPPNDGGISLGQAALAALAVPSPPGGGS